MARRSYIRRLDIVACPLLVASGGGAAVIGGGPAALALAVGGALLLFDVHALVWLLGRAAGGDFSRPALVLGLLPAKYVLVVTAIYVAIVLAQLDAIAFAVGVSVVIVALLGAAVWQHLRTGEEP